jgi:hypothetical protein
VFSVWYEMHTHIQSHSGEKINIFGDDSTGHCGKKKVHTNVCRILSGYRDTAL